MLQKRVWEVPSVKIDPPTARNMQVVFDPLIDKEIAEDFTLTVVTLYPHDGTTGIHTHDDGAEITYVVTGRGEAEVGGEVVEIGPDSVVYIPKGVPHATRNFSDETMKLVCFFIPGLPDERVKGLTEKAMLRVKPKHTN